MPLFGCDDVAELMSVSFRDDTLASMRHHKVVELIRERWQLLIYEHDGPSYSIRAGDSNSV